MKKCRILIPDAGPFNSLWVADALDVLLRLDMPINVVDAVYDEITSNMSYRKDADVRAFIVANTPPFDIVETDIGRRERRKRAEGLPIKKNAGEVAMADFMSSEDGMDRWVRVGEPVLILTEDMRAARRIFLPEPNAHTLGTISLLRGMEKVGLIKSADDILAEMQSPTRPGRRASDKRVPTEPPEGLGAPASGGSS